MLVADSVTPAGHNNARKSVKMNCNTMNSCDKCKHILKQCRCNKKEECAVPCNKPHTNLVLYVIVSHASFH